MGEVTRHFGNKSLSFQPAHTSIRAVGALVFHLARAHSICSDYSVLPTIPCSLEFFEMTRSAPPVNRDHRFMLLIVLMILVGCVRIYSTYDIFSQTWDEPFHIAAGMEWLDKGKYTYELFHPPLARIMSALFLYLNGLRGVEGVNSPWIEGSAILQAGGMYEKNLALARIGILPSFILASLVVALWARNCAGKATSLLATLLFTTLPPVLAHSGLATLDMTCAALVAAALFAFNLWLNKPTFPTSFFLGTATGLAVLSKLSSLGFLIVAGCLSVGLYALNLLRTRMSSRNHIFLMLRRRFAMSVIALFLCSLTIWTGYRFSIGPIVRSENRPHEQIDRILGTRGLLHDVAYFALETTSIPAPEFIKGMNDFRRRGNQGHLAYLMGDIRTQGWWYFYPIVILLKTPLPFIILSLIGFSVVTRIILINPEGLQLTVPVIAAVAVLAVGMLGHVNNGLRQLLSIYPLLAILAGFGAYKLISLNSRFRVAGYGLVIVLLSWQLISSFSVHPDYLPYFNELARNHPEEVVVDSDLDWGQDLKRLSRVLKDQGIHAFKIRYNGSEGINLDHFDLPAREELKPYNRETGWIAISIYSLKLGTGRFPYDQFSWLKDYKPIQKVGKSIWLFYIPSH